MPEFDTETRLKVLVGGEPNVAQEWLELACRKEGLKVLVAAHADLARTGQTLGGRPPAEGDLGTTPRERPGSRESAPTQRRRTERPSGPEREPPDAPSVRGTNLLRSGMDASQGQLTRTRRRHCSGLDPVAAATSGCRSTGSTPPSVALVRHRLRADYVGGVCCRTSSALNPVHPCTGCCTGVRKLPGGA